MKDGFPSIFPQEVKTQCLMSIRDSSHKTYAHYFNTFNKFIKERYGNEKFPLLGVVLYFEFLIKSNLAFRTLLGHRAALKDILPLYFRDYNITEDTYIRNMIYSVKCRKPAKEFLFPTWSLDKVMGMFKYSQTECMLSFFQRVLFLTAIACPLRISQFNALVISRSTFTPSKVVLRTHPFFLSKNQSNTFTPADIVISSHPKCKKLCPVISLNQYLEFSEDLCKKRGIPRPDQIWLDTNLKPLKEVKIRAWFREVIFRADPNAKKAGTNFHSIRKHVSTHLLYKNFSIREILTCMNWQSKSVFAKHYALLGLQGSVDAVLAGQYLDP